MRFAALSIAKLGTQADNGRDFLATQIMRLIKLGSAAALTSLSPAVIHAQNTEPAPAEAREAEERTPQSNEHQAVTIEHCRNLAAKADKIACYKQLSAQREAQIADVENRIEQQEQALADVRRDREKVQADNIELAQEVEGLTQLRDITREEAGREPDRER